MMASDNFPGTSVHRLGGQTALVTGAARGIGRAVAERLASEGASVALLDRTPGGSDATAGVIQAAGGRAIAFTADVTDRQAVRAALAAIEDTLGGIDILVNNAGIGTPAPFLEISDSDWSAMVSTNLGGVFVVGQEVARQMVTRGSGRIVNIASLAAHTANDHQAAYAAAKGGVISLTRAMAFELAKHGISVNAISPGPVDTELAAKMLSPQARRAREDRIPQGRLGKPDEIAAAVAFLASSDAAYVNGAVLVVDGGLLMAGIKA